MILQLWNWEKGRAQHKNEDVECFLRKKKKVENSKRIELNFSLKTFCEPYFSLFDWL